MEEEPGSVNQITQGLDGQSRFILAPAGRQKEPGTASLILELYIWKKNRAPDQEEPGTDHFEKSPILLPSPQTV